MTGEEGGEKPVFANSRLQEKAAKLKNVSQEIKALKHITLVGEKQVDRTILRTPAVRYEK